MKIGRIIFTVMTGALLLALIACAAPTPQVVVVEKAVEVAAERAPMLALPSESDRAKVVLTGGAEQGPLDERMIIRTGNLNLVVTDTIAAIEKIKSIATNLQGYIVTSNSWHEEQQVRARLTLRVPAASFDDAMERIKAVATKVDQENTSGQDVTEEYSDLGAQLRNLEATEKELLQLLTEVRERTGKAEDVLAVHRELTNIRGQIEQVKGRTQYLERMTAMATINVELVPDALAKPIVIAGWRPNATISNALRNLVKTLQFIVDALIWIILYIAPVLFLLSLPLVVLLLVIRRWRRRKST